MNSPCWLYWTDGGVAEVVETNGVVATLHSTRHAATGTPLSATTPLKQGTTIRFKVKDCRRLNSEQFMLFGRWLDLPKAMRELLVSASRAE